MQPIQARDPKPIKWSKAAYEYHEEVSWSYRQRHIKTCQDPEERHLAGLYTRIAEQIDRVATVLTPGDTVELHTVEYAHQFMEAQHKATLGYVIKKMGLGAHDNGVSERILATITKLCDKENTSEVSMRLVHQRIQREVSHEIFQKTVKSLQELGYITVIQRFNRKNRKVLFLSKND